jgi:glucosamine--fructose-6-phosphate aminotransferase (isomerizing)
MCGIIGITGADNALPIILEGLARLEYRGYDSAGTALQTPDGLWVRRKAGKLAELVAATGDVPAGVKTGIGHTRWATHGKPTDENAHPHCDCTGKLAIIHNGIIENYIEMENELSAKGHKFKSQTDTEVLAHAIEEEMKGGDDLVTATRKCLARVEGSFAIVVEHADEPDLLVACRRGSPLVAGRSDGMGLVASDIPAILGQTREIYILEDDQLLEVRPGALRATDLEGKELILQPRTITWDLQAAERGGYEDFMLKEMHEQPMAVRETLRGRVQSNGKLALDEVHLTDQDFRNVRKIFIMGCGSSYYAGLVAKYAIEHWVHLPVEVDIASEFRYREPVLDPETLVIGISQSGETIDTLYALREAKRMGAKVLTISNVVDSSMAREADAVLYTHAGPEIAVASTKCHVAQIVAMQLLALYLAQVRNTVYPDEVRSLLEELHGIADKIEAVLETSDAIKDVALSLKDVRDWFFLGRGISFPVALEGALKLKEISYLRAEGYPGGELKHGPIALIEEGTAVVGVATKSHLQPKLLSNIEEVRARGATIVLVVNEGDAATAALADKTLVTPKAHELFSPAVDVVSLQLLAYHLAKARGNDVDQPRNLAKTVTVE